MTQKKRRGKSLPKSPMPIDGIALSNLSKYRLSPKGVYSLLENRFLKGCKGCRGYMQVWLLCDDGVRRWFGIHRLVAQAFVPNPKNLPVAHHLDHNKLNNNPSNLLWVSYRDNTRFAIEAGRRVSKKGLNHHKFGTKLSQETKQKMSEGRQGIKNARCQGPYYLNGFRGETLKELSQLTGLPMSQIKRLNRSKLKQPGMKLPSRWGGGMPATFSRSSVARRQ